MRRSACFPAMSGLAALITWAFIAPAVCTWWTARPAWAESSPPAYRIIVNPRNPITSVERRFLLEAFLRKTSHWPDGQPIRPVDLSADSPVRRRFTEEQLNRSVAAVKSYWQQSIFAGREVPPPELDSDEAVVRYVLRYPGAIGYVSGGAGTGAGGNLGGAKVLTLR